MSPEETRTTQVLIGLGSNLGDRAATLRCALGALATLPGTSLLAESQVYESDPVGYVDQPRFLNMAAALETVLDPQTLLMGLLAIEQTLGRVRTLRNGPRTIDLDILFFGDEHLRTPDLEIPHPRWRERPFVTIPVAELLQHPRLRKNPAWHALSREIPPPPANPGMTLWAEILP